MPSMPTSVRLQRWPGGCPLHRWVDLILHLIPGLGDLGCVFEHADICEAAEGARRSGQGNLLHLLGRPCILVLYLAVKRADVVQQRISQVLKYSPK